MYSMFDVVLRSKIAAYFIMGNGGSTIILWSNFHNFVKISKLMQIAQELCYIVKRNEYNC